MGRNKTSSKQMFTLENNMALRATSTVLRLKTSCFTIYIFRPILVHTRELFVEPLLVAYRRDKDLKDLLVRRSRHKVSGHDFL